MAEIRALLDKLETNLTAKNESAKLENEIQEIKIETSYLEEWSREHPEIDIQYIGKYKLDTIKTVELFAYLKYISDRSLTLRDKWGLLLRYKIFRSKFLSNVEDRESFIFSLQLTYYKKLLEEKNNKKTALEKTLESADFDSDLKKLKKRSMLYLYQYSNQHMLSVVSS